MQNTLSFLPLTPAESGVNSTFNVVIGYEDFETGKHGKKTFDFLVENLGEECQYNNQMWKFDVLAVSKLREMAAKDAAVADIVIVSAHGKNDLPKEVKAWLELWVTQKIRAIALVGLFDKEDYADNPACSYLAGIAERAHIDFFSQPGLWPKEDYPAAGFKQSSKSLSALIGLAPHEGDVSHWGINE
ncbi:MAG: hypothetical protein H7Y43_02905 [Akkermansiaceae bacterium]|nr:hypothetical protein [Verrucomicrobiales bacterium]